MEVKLVFHVLYLEIKRQSLFNSSLCQLVLSLWVLRRVNILDERMMRLIEIKSKTFISLFSFN